METTILIYCLLSITATVSGLLLFKNKCNSILFFTTLLLIIPTSDQFMFLTSLKGIFFYDYYFLILLIYILKDTKIHFLKNLFLKYKLLISSVVLFITCQIYFIYINNILIDKYLLKDLRPFILIFCLFVFIQIIKNVRIKIEKILYILFYVFIFKILFFCLVFYINPLHDPFYQTYLYRYRDGSTYVAGLFLIIYLFKKNVLLKYISQSFANSLILLSFILVLIANLRILVLALLFTYLFINKTTTKNLIRKIALTITFIGLFMGYSYLIPKIQYNLHGKEKIELRIKNLEDRKLSESRINKEKKILKAGYKAKRYNSLFFKIKKQLETRFFPAIENLNNLNNKKIIIGNGIATKFKIPSFSYRGLDPYLNKIDSFYLTQFIKYGIIGLTLMLLLFQKIISNYIYNKRLRLSIISFYLIVMLVNSVLYQPGTIVHLTFLNLIMISINQQELSKKKLL